MAKINKKTIHIKGMHCPSCEILITDKFKEMPNVTVVNSNFKKQEAEVYFTGHLDQNSVNEKIKPYAGIAISRLPSIQAATESGTNSGVWHLLNPRDNRKNRAPA